MCLYTDMKEERTVLFREAFPDLQDLCKSVGLEFQVVDMRWGVSEHMVADHGVSAISRQQIALCQRLSTGPKFVVTILKSEGAGLFWSMFIQERCQEVIVAVQEDCQVDPALKRSHECPH